MSAPDRSPRDRLRLVLAHPWTDAAVVVLVLVSVGLLVVELSLPTGHPAAQGVMIAGEVLTGVFVVELALRFWAARSKRRFFRTWWPDLLAVLPVVRPLRLFRVLRVLRLFRAGLFMNRRLLWRRTPGSEAVARLSMLVAVSATLVLGAASALRLVEPGELGHLDEAMWYSLFSIVAGEPIGAEPTTLAGRVVSFGLVVGGLVVFGVFVGVVSALVSAQLDASLEVREMDYQDLADHVLVCGWNRSGPALLRELFGQSDRSLYVVLCREGPVPEDLPLDVVDPDRFFFESGDYTTVDVLERVNVRGAGKAILLTDETLPRSDRDRDARTVLAALTIEKLNRGIYTIAEVVFADTAAHLRHADVEEVVVGDWYAGVLIGSAVANPGLVAVLDELLSHDQGHSFHTVALGAWTGATVDRLREALWRDHGATLVGVQHGGATAVNPDGARALVAGDHAIVLARTAPVLAPPGGAGAR